MTRSDPSPSSRRSPAAGLLRRHWGTLLLAILLVVFVVENRRQVSIDLLAVHVRWPLWLVLAVTAAVGVAIGYLLGRQRARRT